MNGERLDLKVGFIIPSLMVMAISNKVKGSKVEDLINLLVKGLTNIECPILRPKVEVLMLVDLLFLSVLSMEATMWVIALLVRVLVLGVLKWGIRSLDS